MAIYLHVDHQVRDEKVNKARDLLRASGFTKQYENEPVPGICGCFTEDERVEVGINPPEHLIQMDLPIDDFSSICKEDAQKSLTDMIATFTPTNWSATVLPGAEVMPEMDLSESYKRVYYFGDLPQRR